MAEIEESLSANFPSEFDNPKDKKKDQWGLKYAQAAWDSARSTGNSFFDNNRERWIRNEKFAEGTHDVDAYKKRAIPSETEWVELDYSVGTPAPKMIRIVDARILDHPYTPSVRMGDSFVQTKMDKKKNEILGKMAMKNMLIKLKNEGVIPEGINPKKLADIPTDEEDIEMYMNQNFSVLEAVVLKKLMRSSFKNNNIKQHEKLLVKDLVRKKMSVLYCCIDEDYRFKVRHVDPIKLVTSYCENEDYSDWKYVGHWEDITISKLREMGGDKFTDKEYFEIAKSAPDYFGNGIFAFGYESYYDLPDNLRTEMEGLKIRLFYFETLQSDKKVYKEKQGDDGYIFFDEKSSDYTNESNDPNQKVSSGYLNKIYEGVWIVGTNYMLRWGLKANIIRKIKGKKYSSTPECSYIIKQPGQHEMINKSLVEEMIPGIENMIIYGIKLQHFVALAPPPGFDIDVASQAQALIGMGLDGFKPLALVDLKRTTGIGYFSSIREDGTPVMNTKPISNTASGLDGGGIETLVTLRNVELANLKEIAGLNDAVDSSTPDSRRLKGVMQQAAQAFNTSIQELSNAYLDTMEEVAARAAYHQILAIRSGKETEESRQLLSTVEYDMIKEVELGEIMYNTYIEMLPDKYEIEQIYMDMASSIKQGSLSVPDSIVIRRAIREGNTDKAELIMEQKIRDKERMDAKRQGELIQQQAQADQAKLQSEMQKDASIQELKTKGEIQQIEAQKGNIQLEQQEKRETEVVKGDQKAEIIKLAHKLKIEAEASGLGYNADKDSMPMEIGGEPNLR